MSKIKMVFAGLLIAVGLAQSSFAAENDEKVVLINVFEVPAEAEAETMKSWLQSRDFLKQQPGYINTRLHKNIDPAGRFRFINVAEWSSPQAFQAAIKKMNETLGSRKQDDACATPGLFRVIVAE